MDPVIASPIEVSESIGEKPDSTYVDVRTVAEFVGGHPRGNVVNVPIVFFRPKSGEALVNDSFLLVIDDLFEKDTAIITGCDDGERSSQAAGRLIDAGYTNVSVLLSGFTGWRQHGLPTSRDNRDGVSYVSVLTKAKRKKDR
jgi:rhodanese-related sulfurtransferase